MIKLRKGDIAKIRDEIFLTDKFRIGEVIESKFDYTYGASVVLLLFENGKGKKFFIRDLEKLKLTAIEKRKFRVKRYKSLFLPAEV